MITTELPSPATSPASDGSALLASFRIVGELKPCLLCGYSPAQARMEDQRGIRFRFVCLNIECANVTDKRTDDGWEHSKQSAAEYWNKVNTPNHQAQRSSPKEDAGRKGDNGTT